MGIHPKSTFLVPRSDLGIGVRPTIRDGLLHLIFLVAPRQPGFDLRQAYVPPVRDDFADNPAVAITLVPLNLHILAECQRAEVLLGPPAERLRLLRASIPASRTFTSTFGL